MGARDTYGMAGRKFVRRYWLVYSHVDDFDSGEDIVIDAICDTPDEAEEALKEVIRRHEHSIPIDLQGEYAIGAELPERSVIDRWDGYYGSGIKKVVFSHEP